MDHGLEPFAACPGCWRAGAGARHRRGRRRKAEVGRFRLADGIQGEPARHRRAQATPELGARSPERGVRQSAYEVRVARTERALRSGQRPCVDLGPRGLRRIHPTRLRGPAPQSGQRYHWQVRVWDGGGNASAWSAPAWWEMGLLRAVRLEGELDRARPAEDGTTSRARRPMLRARASR